MIVTPESITAFRSPAYTSRRCGITELVRVCFVAVVAMASSIGQADASAGAIPNQSTRNLATGGGSPSATAKVAAPITDAAGRIRYIVDLVDNDAGKPAQFADAATKIEYSKTKSAQLIDGVTKPQGVEVLGTTSLVGTSFTAYLTTAQVEQFSKDMRVKLITQDAYIEPSALWNSSTDPSGQVRPWGLYAMDVAAAGSSNGGATVYVLDYGVELHPDLPGLSAANQLSAMPGIIPTGCYPHATHVAGIIGAADNNTGVVGVLPGVKLVSIALGTTNLGSCSDIATTSSLIQGLEIIYEQIQANQKVAIVNLSFNAVGGFFSSTGTVGVKMQAVATPTFTYWPYKGAFIVQSAGNNQADACSYAYNAPGNGILVVGGLDNNGQPVKMLNNLPGYSNAPIGGEPRRASDEAGSNTGGCVGVWAASQRVRSTWGGGSYAFLSGTSMAAPHVAGFAARLLESNPLIITSLDLQAAVGAQIRAISGSNLTMPTLANINATANPTIEIADGSYLSSDNPIDFIESPDQVNLRFEAEGASNCYVSVTRYGYYYSSVNGPTSYNLGAGLPSGQYSWTVTCTSSQGTQTIAVANGYIKRNVTLVAWEANTTSTGYAWQQLYNGQFVTWSLSANAPFSQRYVSQGADYCQVQSFGAYIQVGYVMMGTKLWDSGEYFYTSYEFAPLNLGDPTSTSLPNGPYQGYMWRVHCWNTDDLIGITADMWGTKEQ